MSVFRFPSGTPQMRENRAYSLALDFKALARTRGESRRCQSVSCGFIVTHSDFRVSPLSLRGTPRRREKWGRVACRRRRFLGLRARGSVWRRGPTLTGHALLLRARRSDFRFPTEAPRRPTMDRWMRLEDKRGEGRTGGDPRRRARAAAAAGMRDRRGQGLRQGVRAGAGEGGAAGQPGVGRGGDHHRGDRTGRAPGRAGVERVTVESTSDYWRIWYYLLEAAGLEVQLVNARDVKNVPGRAKTDKLDAVWLAKLTEKGLLRPSFVPPAEIRRLRDYTRLRVDLTHERSRQVHGWRSCSKTPWSRCRRWPPTSWTCPGAT